MQFPLVQFEVFGEPSDLNVYLSFASALALLLWGLTTLALNSRKGEFDKGRAKDGFLGVGAAALVAIVGIGNILTFLLTFIFCYYGIYWLIWRGLILNTVALLRKG